MHAAVSRLTHAQELGDGGIAMLLNSLSRATEAAPGWAKAWHNWALYNVNAMEHFSHSDSRQAQRHVAPAVLGFFRSVQLAQAQGGPRCCPVDPGLRSVSLSLLVQRGLA